MKLRSLMKLAREIDITAEAIDDAVEEDVPKQAVIELITAAKRSTAGGESDFLLKYDDFLLKNVDFITKTGGENEKRPLKRRFKEILRCVFFYCLLCTYMPAIDRSRSRSRSLE